MSNSISFSSLSCPMPKFDFDTINMGHGSGGILTHQLLNSGVFSILQNDMLNQKHDGAIFTANGKLAFSTDSYVIHPLFFPGGNIGELAVNGTVNDLAMCGAFIIEEGLAMKEFWEILVSIKKACDKANVQVVTGDTKVVEKGKGDKIFINTSGIGIMHPHANIALSNIKEGDAVILSGYIADHGVCIMSKREGLEFETDVKSDTVNLNFTIEHLLNEFGNEIHFLRDATRGGVASGACEMLGLDPLYVANEGKFMMVVDAAKTQDVLNALRKDTNGTDATIIGHITKEHIGQVILQSRIGGKRVVNMLPGEQLPRIC